MRRKGVLEWWSNGVSEKSETPPCHVSAGANIAAHKQVVISTGGRDLSIILNARISHFVRNDILIKVLLRRDTRAF
jgi:hypothetical protein